MIDLRQRRGARTTVAIFFFLSGAAGLIYEIVWMRQLTLLFGSTIFAVSAVLTAFMGGLALGSFLFGKLAGRMSYPLLTYGLLEVGIGLYALLLPVILEVLTPFYRLVAQGFSPSFYLFSLLRFSLATGILLIPTILMGGTLPVISQWYTQTVKGIGFGVGRLYAFNTFGAVLGVVGAGFFFLPWWGMEGTTYIAVLLNLTIGIALIGLFKILERGREVPENHGEVLSTGTTSQQTAPIGAVVLLVLVAYGLSGFGALAYEVIWTRVLVLLLGSSTYAFTLMLATFLSGLALGSYLISRVADRLRSPLAIFGLLEIGIGLTALWGMFQFEKLPLLYLSLFQTLSANPALLILGKFLLSALIIFPPTLLMGAVFPVIVRLCNEKSRTVGLSVGRAYGVSTIGAIVGSFAGGFLMIPFLGIQASLTLLVILNLALGLILLFWSRERVMVLSGVGAAVILGIIMVASPPSWNRLVMASGVYQTAPVLLKLYPTPEEAMLLFNGYEELFYKEGWNSTLTVFRKPDLARRPHIAMAIDGKIDASTSRDMSTQVLSAHLPLMVAEHGRNVLVVGYASGVTVGSVLLYPVEQVVVAEIEPAVIEASRYFDRVNHQPLEDPRVRLVLDDARHYLGLTDERFDVIISEPSNPWMSGPSRLFTREFFKLGKEHLTPNGIFAQWIQMYGMKPELLKALVRTFHAVFPEVLIFRVSQADLLLLGAERPLLMDYQRITQLMGVAGIRADLMRVGVRDPLDLLMKFKLGPKEIEAYVGAGPLNTDNNGLVEFEAPKTMYVDTIAENNESIESASQGMAAYIKGIGDAPLEQVNFYLKLARRFLEEKHDRKAEALVQMSLSLSEGAEAYWLLGRIQAQRGFHLTAQQLWNQALQLDPTHAGTLLSLARYDQDRAHFQEAGRYLATAVEVHPGKPWPRYYNGVNLFYLGSYDKASRELEAFLKISPDKEEPHHVLARYYLFQVYDRGGKHERAAAHRVLLIQRLRELRNRLEWDEGEEELDRLLNLIRHHDELGAFHRTERNLRLLVTQHVTDPLAHYYRGVSLYFLGYAEEAAQELKTVLKVLPLGDDSARTRHYLKLIFAGRQGLKGASSTRASVP